VPPGVEIFFSRSLLADERGSGPSPFRTKTRSAPSHADAELELRGVHFPLMRALHLALRHAAMLVMHGVFGVGKR
jgi:hypothetical protein